MSEFDDIMSEGQALKDQFWSQVRRTGDEPSDCWMWTAQLGGTGHGQFWWEGRMMQASRVAWAITVGEVPRGAQIRRTCDSSRCVRPSHKKIPRDARMHGMAVHRDLPVCDDHVTDEVEAVRRKIQRRDS